MSARVTPTPSAQLNTDSAPASAAVGRASRACRASAALLAALSSFAPLGCEAIVPVRVARCGSSKGASASSSSATLA